MKIVKVIILPLLLASILALFSFYGCGGAVMTQTGLGTTTALEATTTTTGGLNQQQLEQILSDSLTNYDNINTYKYDIDMEILSDVSGGALPGQINIIYKISGATNMASQQMQMNMDMSMSAYGSEDQNVIYDMYLLSDWLYVKMEIPGMGEQWIKTTATEELMDSFNTDVVDQQMGPLDSAVKLELLRYENIDGLECYVLAITPDMVELMQWVSEQQGTSEDVSWEELATASDAFKKLTYVCYITKDSNMLKKMILDMEMEFTPEQAGASAGDFDIMIMNMYLYMDLYDHNQPFSVTLPDEAANAVEVSE